MSRLFFILYRTVENLWHRPLASLGSILALTLLFLLFNLVWVATLSTSNYYAFVISDLDIEAFLDDSVPDSTIFVLVDSLGKLDGIDSVEYISKDEARSRLTDLMGMDLIEGFEANPLPRSLVLSFKENFLTSKELEKFRTELQRMQGITEIFYAQQWLEKAEETRRLITAIVIFLAAIIILTATLNLIQAVRISMRNDWSEILQLRLMGAGETFTSSPYLLEGVVMAAIAAVASWIIIDYSIPYLSIREIALVYPEIEHRILSYFAAAGIGLIAGFIGVRSKK